MLNAKSVSADSPFLKRFKAFGFLAREFKLREKTNPSLERKAIYLKYTFNTIVSDFKKAAC